MRRSDRSSLSMFVVPAKQLTAQQVFHWLALAHAFFVTERSTVALCVCAVLLFVYAVLRDRRTSADVKTICETQIAIERIKTPPSLERIAKPKSRRRAKKRSSRRRDKPSS